MFNPINPKQMIWEMEARNKVVVRITIVALVLTLFVLAFSPGIVQAQATETPTPVPVVDYVEIQDGEYIAIERTVSFGQMGIVITLLAILTTVFIFVAYKLVVDKLP